MFMENEPKKNKSWTGIIIGIIIVISLFGLYKWWLYQAREKSCRDFASSYLNLDDKYPLPGQKATSGYNNVDKYKKMYDECMFLQGY